MPPSLRNSIALAVVCSIPSGAHSAISPSNTGYDKLHGSDAICWESFTIATTDGDSSVVPNVAGNSIFDVDGLVDGSLKATNESFAVTKFLSSCPKGSWLQITAPENLITPEPLTGVEYSYRVQGTIDISNMTGMDIASDSGTPKLMLETIGCRVSSSFCSPFVDEQTEAALAGDTYESAEIKDAHVNMGNFLLDLDQSNSSVYSFDVQIPTLIKGNGLYNIIGVATFFVGPSGSQPQKRYDIANSIAREDNKRYIAYSNAPIISQVEPEAHVFAYFMIGVSATILLFMIGLTIRYYNTQVLQICQAPFLLLYELAALMAVLCCVMVEAKNDFYCNWSLPLILIPVHLHTAITLGRLYRIHTVVSPLLSDHFTRASVQRFPIRLQLKILSLCLHGKFRNDDDSKQIRQTVRPKQVVWIIAVWTIPQIVLQVVRIAVQPFELTIQYANDYSIGRPACSAEQLHLRSNIHESIAFYSYLWLGFLGSTVLGMAYVSRGLPSILNESQAIFGSVTSSLVSNIIIGIALYMTRTASASPGLRFIMFVALILVVVMIPTVRIVGPKLLLAHAGVKVMLHQMISEHNNQTKPSRPTRNSTRQSNFVHISGVSSNPLAGKRSLKDVANSTTMPMTTQNEKGHDETNEPNTASDETLSKEEQEASKNLGMSEENDALLIRPGDVPPGEVIGTMIDLQKRLNKITKRIAYGIAVPPEDWRLLSIVTGDLGSTLSNIRFEEAEIESIDT